MKKLRETLKAIALKYPPEWVAHQLTDVERIAFNIDLVLRRKGADITICDIGGGTGLFSVGCAAIGMKSILVDDFQDEINTVIGPEALDLHRSYGVQVIARDVIEEGIDFVPQTLDAVTTFDSLEHWHHSPKNLLASVMQALAPNGTFVLGVPNCVNLRKRITVPLGRGKWSTMDQWYEQERFRGHVREPDVDDLRYIARDMGLKELKIYGRNWLGHSSKSTLIRTASRLVDPFLRPFPRLCSNIYMSGIKS